MANIQSRLEIAKFPSGRKEIAQSILQKGGDEATAKMVGSWKSSKDQNPAAMQKFSRAVMEDTAKYLKKFLKDHENFNKTNDSLPNQLYADASQQILVVNGKEFPGNDTNQGKPGINAFKGAVKDPAARAFLGVLLTQTNIGALQQNMLPNGSPMTKDYPRFPNVQDPFLLGTTDQQMQYTLTTSGGTTGHPEKATVTVEAKYPIRYTEASEPESKGQDVVGYITIRQEFSCNLGKSPRITDAKFDCDFESVMKGRLPIHFAQHLNAIVKGDIKA